MINICYTADAGYAMQVAVSMVSMLENNKQNDLEFFILADQYPESIKDRFKKIEEKYNTKITIIDISEKMELLLNTSLVKEKGIVRNGHISYMFARLFIGSSLPDYLEKVIYIDCDTLYIGDIYELYNTEIQSRYIFAAVRDMWPSSYNETIGLKSDDLYFQSGIMLVDLVKWRKLDCERKILESALKAKHYYYMHDQDLLNVCFTGKIQTLSPKYGMIYLLRHYSAEECIWFSNKDESHYYSVGVINEAKADIHVIHYAGDYFGRPWSFPKACKDNMRWLEYYLKTPWANEQIGNKHSYIEWTKYLIKKIAYPFVDSFWLKKTKRRFEDVNQDMIHTMKEDQDE